jgi:hypothetical protein
VRTVETGRRVVVARAGGPDRLELVETPIPTPDAGQVLIANEAVGVAFADVQHRRTARKAHIATAILERCPGCDCGSPRSASRQKRTLPIGREADIRLAELVT